MCVCEAQMKCDLKRVKYCKRKRLNGRNFLLLKRPLQVSPSHLHIQPTPYSPTLPSSFSCMTLPPFTLAVQCKHFFKVRCQRLYVAFYEVRPCVQILLGSFGQYSHPFPQFAKNGVAFHLKTETVRLIVFL